MQPTAQKNGPEADWDKGAEEEVHGVEVLARKGHCRRVVVVVLVEVRV